MSPAVTLNVQGQVMDWTPLLLSLPLTAFTSVLAYLLGVAKARSTAIVTKQIEAMTQLHDRVIKRKEMELFDGKSVTLMIPCTSCTKR